MWIEFSEMNIESVFGKIQTLNWSGLGINVLTILNKVIFKWIKNIDQDVFDDDIQD